MIVDLESVIDPKDIKFLADAIQAVQPGGVKRDSLVV
jgi:hypothetical protein